VVQEQLEQVEFDLVSSTNRERDGLRGLGIERQIFKAQDRAVDVAAVVTTQQRAQPREQLGQIEGLDE